MEVKQRKINLGEKEICPICGAPINISIIEQESCYGVAPKYYQLVNFSCEHGELYDKMCGLNKVIAEKYDKFAIQKHFKDIDDEIRKELQEKYGIKEY